MIVFHANWTDGALCVWAERARDAMGVHESNGDSRTGGDHHPFCASAHEVRDALARLAPGVRAEPSEVRLRLPTTGGRPLPSARLAHVTGHSVTVEFDESTAMLAVWTAPCVRIGAADAPAALEALDALRSDAPDHETVDAGVVYFAVAARFARRLLSEHRFVPMLAQRNDGSLLGSWTPWRSDAASAEQTRALLSAMPACARAVDDGFGHDPWLTLDDFLSRVSDAQVRSALRRENILEALEGHESASSPAVAWLSGLLGDTTAVSAPPEQRAGLMRAVRSWISGLDDRGAGADWRLCVILDEPPAHARIADLRAPGEDVVWSLRFALQAIDNHEIVVPATDIWELASETAIVDGRRLESGQELLLAELARASRIYPALESALDEQEPTHLSLNTRRAYEYLREVRPLLLEQGVGAPAPEWWDAPGARLGARLQIESETFEALEDSGAGAASVAGARVGLNALVDYRWQIAVGETALTLKEFEDLAAQRAPLVRVEGRWVEIRPEDVQAAVKFIRENPGGQMRVAEAMRIAYTWDQSRTGVPILGLDAKGWVASLLDADEQTMPVLDPPEGFKGELRPYQVRGVSWLAFLNRFGLGACLADDMGLGKTIQLLALLLYEREEAKRAGGTVRPTLVVAPMSVVSNWQREAARFAPSLTTTVHHGVERPQGAALDEASRTTDLTITTYALANRDREQLARVEWGRVVLDEAQNVKNPNAKQSQAVRSLRADHRVALTGTPVENRLSELWSIIDFCNPGHLGTSGDFRRRFAAPIERHHDRARVRQLRDLVRPFVLRRLKTDPGVTADLPPKVETKEYCRLTPEQAALYESAVKRMLLDAEQTEGMQRRGLVLASLIRLKQICNHPSQLLRDHENGHGATAERSGKCVRLIEMLDEALSAGDQALVFTQFREMGKILASMLSRAFDREILFMHGGSTQAARQQMIDRFQRADGTTPIFLLSLKAGGVGLNLTAASHVFHFDRWWNPAVENQATDRAHRIGQSRTVQVHKFIVGGTLEERIDQMIEQKTELATSIIGAGEQWLTELSTAELRDLVRLGPDAVDDESAPAPKSSRGAEIDPPLTGVGALMEEDADA